MKNNFFKFSFILIFVVLVTGCPKAVDSPKNGDEPKTDNDPPKTEISLTQKISAAQTSIDFENATIEEDAVVSKAILVKNLNLNGKKLTLEASGIELQNVNNAIIVVDEKVGEGDVTLTNCSSITKLEINGGGANSIHVNNSKIASVEVKKDNVRVALEESSEIDAVVVSAANTKIESEENIVINEITVSQDVDKITIKGGTVEKVQTEKTQIVIDGKTEVKSLEGTTDVQLTKEAIQSGSNVVIKAPVPVVTYYDSTIVFLSDGDLTGTEFEGEDVYYEYVFDYVSMIPEIKDMNIKIKLFKLQDCIKCFYFAVFPDLGPYATEMEDEFNTGTFINGNTFTFKDMYDINFVLKSAGLIKGNPDNEALNTRASLESPEYDEEFDIKDCGIPELIILPVSPAKPKFTVTPSSEGNVITLTFNESDDESYPTKFISDIIKVYQGVKESGNWVVKSENQVFSKNSNGEKTVTFTDCFVTPGKEYAYFYYVSRRESQDSDIYATVTATGGYGEIELSAQNSTTDNGIKITITDVPSINAYANYQTSKTIFRYYENDTDEKPGYAKIGQYITDTGMIPIVDYYTDIGTSYTYTANYAYWNNAINTKYYPIVKPCTITATVGLGEPKIKNSPAGSVNENKYFTFTTEPQINEAKLKEYNKYNITFNYVYTYKEDEDDEDYSTDNKTILYDKTIEQPESNKISSWYYPNIRNKTYKYDNSYDVFITYKNGINYNYVYTKEQNFTGMSDITVE